VEFEIIDKAHQGASAFGMQVAGLEADHPSPRQLLHGILDGPPRRIGVSVETQGLDLVGARLCVAGDAIR
jgi:hypothetical protein